MASETHQFISSRFVKEIARLGGDVGSFVSPRVAQRMRRRFNEGDDAGPGDSGAPTLPQLAPRAPL
jgi:pantetheine-phosphate adenylyltransferase